MEMTKRERFQAALKGDVVDRPPISVWLHFASEHLDGAESARRHLDFQRAYDWDYVKAMNDYRLPLPDAHATLGRADLARFQPLAPSAPFLAEQLVCLKAIRRRLGADTPILETIFNPLQTLVRASGRGALAVALANPAEAKIALEAVTETLIGYVYALRDIGVDGLFYSINGAVDPAHGGLTDEQYSLLVAPYDQRILAAAEGMARMVHIHGFHLRFDRCADLPCEAFSWSHFNSGPSLTQARALTRAALVGGLNEQLIDRQSEAEAIEDVRRSLAEAGPGPLILGPGCAIPSDTPHHVLKAVADAARALTAG